MTALLNVKDLRAYYGQVQALHGLQFARTRKQVCQQVCSGAIEPMCEASQHRIVAA